jgi:hypothetical protein
MIREYMVLIRTMTVNVTSININNEKIFKAFNSDLIYEPCRWTNHLHRVLKRFIETKVPPGTPNAVMAQTGTEKKKKIYEQEKLST